MQLAWLLRPDGQNFDALVNDLKQNRDLDVLEAIRQHGPRVRDGSYMTGADLIRILDGITGRVLAPEKKFPTELGPQDSTRNYRADARDVFPLDMTVSKAIDLAESTARWRLKKSS